MAKILVAHPSNIKKIASLIAQNKLVVMPYGKKERRVFAIVGLANDLIVSRMKKIKARDASQAVAISAIPDVAPMVGQLNKTPALVRAASRLKITPQQVIERCFQIGGIGLILVAQKWLPKGATMLSEKGIRTVLIAGEASSEEYDIFPKVYKYLIKHHNQVMVGTSANIHGEDTYHILQQDMALNKLKNHVDLFIRDKIKLGIFPLFKHLTSSTVIDLTGDRPKVVRWGSIHPFRFKKIFPDLYFKSSKLKHFKGRERLYHIFFKNLILPFKKLFRS